MHTAKRYSTVKMDKSEKTSNGFLRVPAYLTRTGVFTYIMADGRTLKELRHPDDVFREDSLKTLRAVPLTNEHPKKLVDPETVKSHMIGWIGDNIAIDNIYLKADVNIVDGKSIADVESGKQELSCGYTADLVTEKGIYNGEIYDVRQTNIVYNHVSLVKRGRAGAMVKLHLDSEDAVEFTADSNNLNEENEMAKFKIGDQEVEVSAEAKDALDKWAKGKQEEMDSLQKKMNDMMPKADMDKMKGKCDALEAQLAETKTKLDSATTDEAKIKEGVKVRVALVSQASKVLKADVKTDDMSDLEIKKAVVKEKFPKTVLDGKSEDYVQAMFDQAVLDASNDSTAQADLNDKAKKAAEAEAEKNKNKPLSATEARNKMIADTADAYKTRSEIKGA